MFTALFSPLPVMALLLTGEIAPSQTSAAPASPTTSPAPPKTVSFPFYSSGTRMLVMMRVNGGTPAPVVFDTGTNGNVLDTLYAEQIKVPNVGPSQSVDGATGHPIPGYTTQLTGITLGGVAIDDGPATVMEYKRRDEVGVFGPNSFPGKLTEIDFPRSRIRILPDTAETRPSEPGHPHVDDLPAISITLPGMTVDALLDTGNNTDLTLPLSLAASLPLKSPPVVVGVTRSAGGSQKAYEAQIIGEVHIGPVVLQSPVVTFNEGGLPNVGMPVLRQFRLLIDHTNQLTWIEPAAQ